MESQVRGDAWAITVGACAVSVHAGALISGVYAAGGHTEAFATGICAASHDANAFTADVCASSSNQQAASDASPPPATSAMCAPIRYCRRREPRAPGIERSPVRSTVKRKLRTNRSPRASIVMPFSLAPPARFIALIG